MSSTKTLLEMMCRKAQWIELFNVVFAAGLLVVAGVWWARAIIVVVLLWQLLLLVSSASQGLVASTIALFRAELELRLTDCPAREDSARNE